MKNNTFRKIATALVLATGLAGSASAFAGYYTTQCNAFGCWTIYVPTCTYYGCW